MVENIGVISAVAAHAMKSNNETTSTTIVFPIENFLSIRFIPPCCWILHVDCAGTIVVYSLHRQGFGGKHKLFDYFFADGVRCAITKPSEFAQGERTEPCNASLNNGIFPLTMGFFPLATLGGCIFLLPSS